MTETSIIEVEHINSYYGDSHVLFDVCMQVREREVVALLGRNGAGKSTTLKTLAGVLHPRSGTIRFDGQPIELLPSHKIAESRHAAGPGGTARVRRIDGRGESRACGALGAAALVAC